MTTEDVEKLIKKFDFDSVKKCMDGLGWTYYDTKPDVPSTERLKITARKCLMDVIGDEGVRSHSTGGFVAERGEDEEGQYLYLSWTPVSISIYP